MPYEGMGSLIRDARFGVRMLRKNPGFTAVAVLTLALGIGAATVVFGVFDAVLLRPLPVRHPEELVRIVQHRPRIGTDSNFPRAYYEALRDHATTLASVFGATGSYLHFAMTDPAPTEQILLHAVTPEFFEALGVEAFRGRVLTAEDAKENPGTPPAVLSYAFWQRRFGGDPQAVGRTIGLQQHRFVIVGVMPPGFNGYAVDSGPDVTIPLNAYPLLTSFSRLSRFELAARLKPGVTRSQAQAECISIWNSDMESYLRNVEKDSPATTASILSQLPGLDPLERGVSIVRDRFGLALELLMASVCLLLLIASANVASLQLARGATRRQEMAARMAIGATRWRLVRQMLIENSLLAVLGATGGLWIAHAATPLALRFLPPMRDLSNTLLPLALDVHMSWRILIASAIFSGLALLLFGLAPALAASRVSLDSVLRAVRSGGTSGGRRVLLVVQVALCTFLLAGAGLLVRTLRQLRGVDQGFDSQAIATFTLDDEAAGYTAETEPALLRNLEARVRQLPGVESVALAGSGIMRGRGLGASVAPAGQRITRADFLNTSLNDISPDYFETLGIRVLSGRTFTEADDPKAKPGKAVVNRAFAQRFFPNVEPLGKYFGNGMDGVAGADLQIIGVVSDSHYRSLREVIYPTFYLQSVGYGSLVMYVRTRGQPHSLFVPVEKTLASIDPGLSFLEVHTLDEEVDASLANDRVTATLASIFAGAAALLVAIGIYGLLAYSTAQKTREIGVRMALGAQKGEILAMVIGEGMRLATVGVAIGIAGALALTRLLSGLLFGVAPDDPLTFGAVAVLLLGVTLVACFIPARRAMRVEPMVALRYE